MARKSFSYFGNSEFQSKMLGIFAGISLFQGAFYILAGYGLIQNIKGVAASSGLAKSHVFFENIKSQETLLYLFIITAVGMSTILFIWLGLKVTYDAVGAIYRIKKDIEKMTSTNELFRIKLRRNDYFRDFEHSFNELVISISPQAEIGSSGDVDLDEFTPTPHHIPGPGKNQ